MNLRHLRCIPSHSTAYRQRKILLHVQIAKQVFRAVLQADNRRLTDFALLVHIVYLELCRRLVMDPDRMARMSCVMSINHCIDLGF